MPDYGFQLQHDHYCTEINQIEIDSKEPVITKEEMIQARAVLGAIQWRALHSGPQHLAKLSWLQSALPCGGKDVLQQVNKLCREVYAQRFVSVRRRKRRADSDRLHTQQWATGPIWDRLVYMWWRWFTRTSSPGRSGKLPRIARSSLSAEVQSLAEGEQEMMLCRAAWGELLGGELDRS